MKTKVIAVINQKGGVGKTTTVANLGYALGKMGRDVLLIDFDSQASLTNYLNVGLGADDQYYGIYEMMLKALRPISREEDSYLADLTFEQMCQDFIIRPTYLSAVTKTVDGVKQVVEEPKEFGVSLLPSRLDLSDYELELGRSVNFNGYHLYNIIHDIIAWHEYDYILIDCNPSLGILTMNAITAAVDGVLIPTNLDVMSTRGVVNLINRVVSVQELLLKNANVAHMGVIGIVLNLYADRRTVDKTIQTDMERFYPFKIFNSKIPESVNAKKAALTGVTYSQMYKKAEQAYADLALEFEEKLAQMQAEGPKIIRMAESMPTPEFNESVEED